MTAFTVLAEPNRRRILDLLLERPRPVGDLVERLGLTQPATSKHLRVLREAGLVRARTEAQRRVYEVDPRPLAEVEAWLPPHPPRRGGGGGGWTRSSDTSTKGADHDRGRHDRAARR